MAHARALPTTRVEIARERQEQELLSSMNRRATLQTRAQQTPAIVARALIPGRVHHPVFGKLEGGGNTLEM